MSEGHHKDCLCNMCLIDEKDREIAALKSLLADCETIILLLMSGYDPEGIGPETDKNLEIAEETLAKISTWRKSNGK